MIPIQVELPEDLAVFIAQSAGGDLSSAEAEAFVLGLIEQARERHELLMAELQKGLESGVSERTIDEIFDAALEQVKSRAA